MSLAKDDELIEAVCTENLKPADSGDEAHQGPGMNLLIRSAERDERRAHLCPMIGAFWCCCNSECRIAESGADVLRPRPRNHLDTRAESIRLAVRQSRSARASPVRWVCPEYPWRAIGKKRTFKSNNETDERKKMRHPS